MKILIDMNLSPLWVEFFAAANIEAVHWSTVGNPAAIDSTLMAWVGTNSFIVFTHDLDFGALLAINQAKAPSVIQVRTQDVLPKAIGGYVLIALRQFQADLEAGALLTIDLPRSRIRLLPIARS